MDYNRALTLANELIAEIRPFCKRIEIGGSIRRKKSFEIKDIELILIPTWELEKWAVDRELRRYKAGDKMWQFMWKGEKVDMFLCTPETWGIIYLIRTGSAEWVTSFMCWIQHKGFCSRNARLCRITGEDNDMFEHVPDIKEEIDIFRALNLPWVEPECRIGKWT
jgi:DNA polymerase/3'-5' exonuclease PolX